MTSARLTLSLLLPCLLLALSSPAGAFIRGDADRGGTVDIGDGITILEVLFQPGTPPLECEDAGDVNDDGMVNIGDVITLLAALFQTGAPPIPAPYPDDGVDPTPDMLPSCDPQGVLAFTTLSQGQNSGITTPTQDTITDAATWTTFWTQHSNEPIPAVDFNTEMVIVILGTFDNAGVTYDVNQIEVSGALFEIRFTVVLPGAFFPAVSQPHHFVKCPKVSLTPTWVETVIALP